MTPTDRDRLVALKKAKAEEWKVSERQVRRWLVKLKQEGDQAIIHGLRGRSNRKIEEETREKAVEILRRDVYRGFGPTLAAEYLENKHQVKVSKETIRQWMRQAGWWRSRKPKVVGVHVWRERRERFGELVPWDTSTHDWLEGRGEKIYLIQMIDDATSRLFARFVRGDSTAGNMAVLEEYLRRFGRPLEFYTDQASHFQTTPKKNHPKRDEPLPPTQIGRALGELGIGWIAAHSPQAKGRVERSFETAQDRLVKGLRVAGATTLEAANAYLEAEYLPTWQAKFTVVPAGTGDAHRPLGKTHDLAASLSEVESRVVTNDYTIRHANRVLQIGRYLRMEERHPAPKPAPQVTPTPNRNKPPRGRSQWMDNFLQQPALTLREAMKISNATS